MTTTVYNVDGMTCGHCAAAVKGNLYGIDGVEAVAVDLEGKTVTVTYGESVDPREIAGTIEELGYDVLQ